MNDEHGGKRPGAVRHVDVGIERAGIALDEGHAGSDVDGRFGRGCLRDGESAIAAAPTKIGQLPRRTDERTIHVAR